MCIRSQCTEGIHTKQCDTNVELNRQSLFWDKSSRYVDTFDIEEQHMG